MSAICMERSIFNLLIKHEKESSGETLIVIKRLLFCLRYLNVAAVLKSAFFLRLFRQANHPIIEIEEPKNHGWNKECSFDWVTVPYPRNMVGLLINRENNASENEISDPEEANGADFSDNGL